MNTNLVVSLIGVLVTNWTGHHDGTNEIGVVKSNTVAQVAYGGVKHELLLKSEHTMRYVLREDSGVFGETNVYIPGFYIPWDHHDMTNYLVTNYIINSNVVLGAGEEKP